MKPPARAYDHPARQGEREKRDTLHSSFLTAGIIKNGWFYPFDGSIPHRRS